MRAFEAHGEWFDINGNVVLTAQRPLGVELTTHASLTQRDITYVIDGSLSGTIDERLQSGDGRRHEPEPHRQRGESSLRRNLHRHIVQVRVHMVGLARLEKLTISGADARRAYADERAAIRAVSSGRSMLLASRSTTSVTAAPPGRRR